MPTYVLPQVLVFQDFNLRPVAETRPLNALVAGGHAVLYRYSQAEEKSVIGLGKYDHLGTSIDGDFKTCYDWPEKPANATIDTDYTRLFIDNALLRYFTDASGTMEKIAANKIRHPSISFKANPVDPVGYPRDAIFFDRDVKVGDIVRVVASDGTDVYPLSTYIKDIEADQTAATVETAEANPNNAANNTVDADGTKTAGTGTVPVPTIGAGWKGVSVGLVHEVYTVVVTQASTGGNHTTARLRVTSATGLDDDLVVTPAAAASPTAIGNLGLSLTFAAGNFIVGDTYTIDMDQAWTAPVATAAGTYTGTTEKTYIVTVTKGKLFADGDPEITVTASDGTDFSGPHAVPDAAAAVPIGTEGLTIAFSGAGLNKGDRYSIAASPATDGEYRILVLGHSLDSDVPLDNAATAAIDLALYIKKNIEVDRKNVSIPGQVTFDQTDDQVCVHGGINAFDASYTDSGEPVALPVVGDEDVDNANQVYIEYRAWDQTHVNEVNGINDVADLDEALTGATHPDNPLKWALFKALSNNNNAEVKYIAVSNPDGGLTDNWQVVIDKIEDRNDVYGLVPLTKDRTVLNAFQAHVQSSSTATAGRWRALWVNQAEQQSVAVANETTEGEVVMLTTEDDVAVSGTQYTLFKGTPGSGVFANARVGDTIRYQYATDDWDELTYSTYIIEDVMNDDQVRVTAGTSNAEDIPLKAEVWRDLSSTEQAERLAVDSGSWADRRVRSVWPDRISSGGIEMEGYHLCAALAALCSGVVPHQGLTHLEIKGFDDVPQTTKKFSRTQLDTMAGAGTWIVTQDSQTGAVFTRHCLTTGDQDDLNEKEEQVTRNVDSISFHFLDTFAPYIGVSNVTPSMLDIIEAETLSAIQFLRRSGETPRLGGQLIDATIIELRAHAILRDRIVLGLSLQIPYSLNNLEIHLVI